MTKRKTNVQIVKEMMEKSQYGALSQAFVMEAISRYSEEISKTKPTDYPKNSFIYPEAWIGIAKEIQDKLKKEQY